MYAFVIAVIRAVVLKLATTAAFSFLHPRLIKLDKWCEEKLGIDIIKQEKKLGIDVLSERIAKLEEWSHPPVAPGGATELKDEIARLEKRIEELEKLRS